MSNLTQRHSSKRVSNSPSNSNTLTVSLSGKDKDNVNDTVSVSVSANDTVTTPSHHVLLQPAHTLNHAPRRSMTSLPQSHRTSSLLHSSKSTEANLARRSETQRSPPGLPGPAAAAAAAVVSDHGLPVVAYAPTPPDGAPEWQVTLIVKLTQMMELIGRLEVYPGFLFTCIMLLFAFVIGCWGFSVLWLVLPIAAWIHDSYRVREKREIADGIELRRLMDDDNYARELLGDNAPAWLRNPDSHKVPWLNNAIEQWWPFLREAIEKLISEVLTDALDANRPSVISTLSVERVFFGSRAPLVSGVRTYRMEEELRQLLFDIDILLNGDDMDVMLAVGYSAASAKIQLTNMSFSGTLRIMLEPLMKSLPGFGAISISFVQKPILDFDLSALKVNIMNLPGVSTWVSDAIKDGISASMVWPKKLVIPVTEIDDEIMTDLGHSRPKGLLRGVVVEAKDLINVERFGESDPFCVISLCTGSADTADLANEASTHQTRVKTSTLNPVWKEQFEFLVTDKNAQVVHVHVFDHERVGSPRAMGHCSIAVCDLPRAVCVDRWYPIEQGNGALHLILEWVPFSASASDTTLADVKDSMSYGIKHLQAKANTATVLDHEAALSGAPVQMHKSSSDRKLPLPHHKPLTVNRLASMPVDSNYTVHTTATSDNGNGSQSSQRSPSLRGTRNTHHRSPSSSSAVTSSGNYDPEKRWGLHRRLSDVVFEDTHDAYTRLPSDRDDDADADVSATNDSPTLNMKKAHRKRIGSLDLDSSSAVSTVADGTDNSNSNSSNNTSNNTSLSESKSNPWSHPSQLTCGVLVVYVDRCENLVAEDASTKSSDPYVILTVGNETFRTQTVCRSLDPKFGCRFQFKVSDVEADVNELKVQVFDKDLICDDKLGSLSLSMAMIQTRRKMKDYWDLDGVAHGRIYLELEWLGY
jgi:Synaptotagmin-like mitochondrial-lipid-binding domain/C2 domain